MRQTQLSSLYVLAFALAVACSDSSTGGGGGLPSQPVDDGFSFPDGSPEPPDGTLPDAPDAGGEDTTTPPPTAVTLEFKQPVGDDGKSCKAAERCSVIMSYNGERLLEVVAKRDGKVAADEALVWEISKNPGNSLKLTSKNSLTGQDGVGSTTAKQTTQQTAQYEVTVRLANFDKATPLKFDIAVTPKGQVPLIVTYTYKGKRSFQGVTTYVLKQTAKDKYPCAGLDPSDLPTADTQSGPKGLSQSHQFVTLPGLDSESSPTYTIVGIGADAGKPPVVWGCNDKDATVSIDKSKQVSIELKDLPPKWKGKYDVTTLFDLVSALPDQVEGYVNMVLGFFTDPAGQIMVIACQYGKNVGVISDLCGYVFADPDNPCLEDSCFKSVGLAVKSLIENALYELLQDNVGGDVFFTGQDVAKILKELELGATFEFKNEPKADGTFTSADTFEEWHSVTYRWTLNSNCDPQDEACGKYTFNIQAFQGDTITGAFGGHVDYSTGEYLLNIDPHSINIKYGQLVKWLVEKEILPRIAGDGSDGLPKVDSFDKLIKSLLGGKECLKLDDCCEKFATKLSGSQTGGFTKDLAKAACDALIPLAVDQLDKFLIGLDADTGENFTIATQEACKCLDLEGDMTIDTWGSKGTPCHWDTNLKIGGYETKVKNDFWAVEQE